AHALPERAAGAAAGPVEAADAGVEREVAALGRRAPGRRVGARVPARRQVDARLLLEPLDAVVHHGVVAAGPARAAVRGDAEHAPGAVVELEEDRAAGVALAAVLAAAADERLALRGDAVDRGHDLALDPVGPVVGVAE